MTTDSEVVETTIHWVPDVGHTRGRETRYWKTIELYWHIKTFMGQMLQTREDAQNMVQLQLDGLPLDGSRDPCSSPLASHNQPMPPTTHHQQSGPRQSSTRKSFGFLFGPRPLEVGFLISLFC
jgi:hypothetical protein